MDVTNLLLIFLYFYICLYIACKLNNIKFTITKKNFIIILAISILYDYLIKLFYFQNYKILITTICIIIIFISILKNNILTLIQTSLFTILIMIISELLIGSILINILHIKLNSLYINKMIYFSINILIYFTAIIIINLKQKFVNLLKLKNKLNNNDSLVNNIFMISILVIIMINYFFSYKYFNQKTFLNIFILSILHLILTLTYIHKNYVLQSNKEEYNQLKLYTSIIETLVDDVSKFKHDYNNIIFMINGYIENNNLDELKKILSSQICSEYQYVDIPKLKKIKDAGLKGLLTSEIVKMHPDNINVSIEILNDIDIFHIDMIDLCRILGILIDNAHEAAKISKEKIVSISFIQEDILNITISNSYNNNININNIYQYGFSTKGNNRGIGLKNVTDIIDEKYPNILLKTSIKENLFIQDIYIKAK